MVRTEYSRHYPLRERIMITAQELVQAGLYPDEQTVAEEALQVLWQERLRLRLDWAVYQYQVGKSPWLKQPLWPA